MPDLPDWFAASVIKGLYGTELKTIQVDELGRLYAILRALYGTTQKDVQCDTNGNLTLNLKAQDLAEIINRPKYGACQQSSLNKTMPATEYYTLVDISGKGVIYGGFIYQTSGLLMSDCNIEFTIDSETFGTEMFGMLFARGITIPFLDLVYIRDYDETNAYLCIGFTPNVTFETRFKVRISSTAPPNQVIAGKLYYALV